MCPTIFLAIFRTWIIYRKPHGKHDSTRTTTTRAWKALPPLTHKVPTSPLPDTLPDDATRGAYGGRAVGLYFDSSNPPLTDETPLLLQLAEESGLRAASCHVFAGQATSREARPSCTWPCALPKGTPSS